MTTPPIQDGVTSMSALQSPDFQINKGWALPNKDLAGQQSPTGNPMADFLLRLTQQAVIPPAPSAPFERPRYLAPHLQNKLGGPFYAQAAGRADQSLARYLDSPNDLLGEFEKMQPALKPYGTLLRAQPTLGSLPGVGGLSKYL